MDIRSKLINILMIVSLAVILTSCIFIKPAHAGDSLGDLIAQLDNAPPAVEQPDPVKVELVAVSTREIGRASYYGRNHHGRRTASGQRFDMWGMTAAHKSLPFGTCLAVQNTQSGKSALVTVNDRGPYVGNRVLDLSQGAAVKLGMIKSGVATIEYHKVTCPTQRQHKYF